MVILYAYAAVSALLLLAFVHHSRDWTLRERISCGLIVFIAWPPIVLNEIWIAMKVRARVRAAESRGKCVR